MKKKTDSGRINIQKTAVYGVLAALALALSYLESQLPAFFPIPGMKLGLTNIIVVLALYKTGGKSAMAMNVLRIVMASVLFGGPSALMYSLAGGMLSTAVMIILKRTGAFRVVTVSIAGGVAHNIGQIIVAVLVTNTVSVAWYLALLWFTGMASGALIGIIGSELIRRLPDSLFEGKKKE